MDVYRDAALELLYLPTPYSLEQMPPCRPLVLDGELLPEFCASTAAASSAPPERSPTTHSSLFDRVGSSLAVRGLIIAALCSVLCSDSPFDYNSLEMQQTLRVLRCSQNKPLPRALVSIGGEEASDSAAEELAQRSSPQLLSGATPPVAIVPSAISSVGGGAQGEKQAEWLVQEEWALLTVLLRWLLLPPTPIQAAFPTPRGGRCANWELAADYVNQYSRVYRSDSTHFVYPYIIINYCTKT